MSDISRLLLFMVGCVFTHNVVFDRALGVTETIRERRVETAIIYGVVVTIVMTLTGLCASIVESLILAPMKLEALRVVIYMAIVLLAALLTQAILKKAKPAWVETLGDCLLPVAANCALLGVALMDAEAGSSVLYSLLGGLSSGIGFTIAIVLMAGVQEKIEFSDVPRAFKGLPISLISAGLVALAFIGFRGMA